METERFEERFKWALGSFSGLCSFSVFTTIPLSCNTPGFGVFYQIWQNTQTLNPEPKTLNPKPTNLSDFLLTLA
jgi:hypothetical protein